MPKTKTPPTFDPQALAFNAEAVRGYMFRSALEIVDGMRKDGIPHAEAALLTGTIEMVAQLWAQIGFRAGNPPGDTRRRAERQFRLFFHKHLQAERNNAPEVKLS